MKVSWPLRWRRRWRKFKLDWVRRSPKVGGAIARFPPNDV
jgi:hypothetical protein